MGRRTAVPLLAPQLCEKVDRASSALLHGCLESGHEAVAEVEDERGGIDVPHIARRQLEVVRLGARGREVADVDSRSGDLLDGEGDRVEGGHDGLLGRTRARGAATDEQRCRYHERATKENDSRKHVAQTSS